MLPVLENQGYQVTTIGGGAALDVLGDRAGHREVEPIPLSPVQGARVLARRVRADRALLRALRAELVICDGDPGGMLAAASLGIPRVALGHDVVFARARMPAGLSRVLLGRQQLNSWFTLLADAAVGVNFLPLTPTRARTWIARPMPPDGLPLVESSGQSLGQRSDEPVRVLCYFRDGNGDGLASLLATSGARVVLYGSRASDVPGVQLRGFDRARFLDELAASDAVVCSAGVNLLTECVYAGKPVLACHHRREAEQAMNAAMLEGAGAGARVAFDAVDQRVVTGFLARVRARGFRRIDLASSMPDVGSALLAAIAFVSRP